MRIGPRLGWWLRDLTSVDRVRAVDWGDHSGLLRRGSAGKRWTLVSRIKIATNVGKSYWCIVSSCSFIGRNASTSLEILPPDMGSFALLRMTIEKQEDAMTEQTYYVILYEERSVVQSSD